MIPVPSTRRVSIDLRKFGWFPGIRPTIVIEGRGQPTQWGVGTWQLPADHDSVVSVYLHLLGVTWGRASYTLRPEDAPALVYRAPLLIGLPGTLRAPK